MAVNEELFIKAKRFTTDFDLDDATNQVLLKASSVVNAVEDGLPGDAGAQQVIADEIFDKLPFQANGTGSVVRLLDAKVKDEFMIAGRDFGLPDSGDCEPAITDAIERAAANGGGRVWLPPIVMITGATIDNKYPRVMVESSHSFAKDQVHDVFTADVGAVIVPAFAGTVLKHRTPYGTSATPVHRGGGFRGLKVIGNSLATRLLEVDSIRDGVYDLTLIDSVGTEAALFTCGVTGTDFGEACDVQFCDIDLAVSQITAGAARDATCVKFTGSANANFSKNKHITIRASHWNGHALDIVNADNNLIWLSAFRVGGTGNSVINRANAVEAQRARVNDFMMLSTGGTHGPVVFEGTDIATWPATGLIWRLDRENGTPFPTLGTSASCPVLGASMNVYTPVVEASSGTITSYTATGRWCYNGKRVIAFCQIGITDNGTGAGVLKVSLPTPQNASVMEGLATGHEYALVSFPVSGIITSQFANLQRVDATYPGATGRVFIVRLEYEAN